MQIHTDPVKARRAAATREARRAQLAWEGRIENALEAARQARIVADYVHTEPSFARNGTPLERSVSDFVGALEGGLALGIEVKTTKERRFAHAKISERQVEHLDRLWRAGSLSALAPEFRIEGTGMKLQFVVPWGLVPWEKKVSALSVTADGLTSAGFKPIGPTGVIAELLHKCQCGAFYPRHSGRSRLLCCASLAPFPF